MIRLLFVLALLCPPALAGGFAEREDVRAFVAEMEERHGFAPAELLAKFREVKPMPAVLKAIAPPADPGIKSWQAYRARFIEPKRIAAGRLFLARHAEAFAAAEERFRVPRHLIAAIVGIETLYGKQLGRFPTFGALANLAFDYPPRAALFRRELEELLLLARDEARDPLAYRGSFAGALGLPQFLPSSIRRWATDFRGDGRVDLGDPVDTIGSIARFFAGHGWQPGAPIADTVAVDGENVQAVIDLGIAPQLTAAEMAARGLRLAKVGAGDTALPELQATLVDLMTPGAATEYRLGYRNFYVITRYNRSSFYAAAVMDLAAELQ